MMGRNKDEEGEALWHAAMGDVTPLEKPVSKTPAQPSSRKPKPVRQMPSSSPTPPSAAGRDIDRRTRQKFERGQMGIEAVLDLHGHARDSAYATMIAFLLDSYHAGRRCVLVITGKGKAGTGVLKASFTDWVNAPPLAGIVLETSPAKPKDGGSGAFYVYLRRQRG